MNELLITENQIQDWRGAWLRDYLKSYPQVNGESVEVGMPATVGVGSDSYATVVTEVVRFKSGARAGLINYIKVDRFEHKFYAKELKKCYRHENHEAKDHCVPCYQKNLGVYNFKHKDWFKATVGYAIDYRDPHR